MQRSGLSRLQIVLLLLALVVMVLGFLSHGNLWLKGALYVVGIAMIWYAARQITPPE